MSLPFVPRLKLWLPPVVYMVVIFRLSAEPAPLPEVTAVIWDKLLHAMVYAGLAVLFCRALFGEGLDWTAGALVALLLTSAYGASDEVHQHFVPLRSAEVGDWFADTTGAALGALVGTWVLSRVSRRPRRLRR